MLNWFPGLVYLIYYSWNQSSSSKKKNKKYPWLTCEHKIDVLKKKMGKRVDLYNLKDIPKCIDDINIQKCDEKFAWLQTAAIHYSLTKSI